MRRLINQRPNKTTAVLLGLLPFVILIILYMVASDARLALNPNDKLLPSFSTIVEAINRLAFTPSRRTGELVFWQDTASSLIRLGLGIGISALIGLIFGISVGALPLVRAKLSPIITAISLIPPMAVLPVLFIVLGLGELSKVVLIVIGTAPFIIRDLEQRVREIPAEQIIKAQTLGANSWQIIIRVILPQIIPRLISAVRLSLGAAWLFLIAAEAIASTDGLGYRIFLVRRYLSMDIILPYVVWITFLAFATDYLLRIISEKGFPWFHSHTADAAK